MRFPFRAFHRLRHLRLRLALTFLASVAALLTLVGLLFRNQLDTILETQTRNLLEEEWGALKGYVRVEKGEVQWIFDREDPEEALIVDRLKEVYLLASENKAIQWSPIYRSLGIEPMSEIRAFLRRPWTEPSPKWRVRQSEDGESYLVRTGRLIEDSTPKPQVFYVSIGRSLEPNRQVLEDFTRRYFTLLPLLVFGCGVLGWFVAGRALRPVNHLAQTAERITSNNLHVQIPERGAKDELDNLVRSFNRMVERLAASFTQTRQFSTDVSHELRTPLTVIRGQLEVALMTANTPEQYREAILESLQEVDRVSHTIRALLQLAQAESGQITLQKAELDLSDMVAEITDQYQIVAESAGVALDRRLEPDCTVQGDRVQLERLVYNLLSNAVKYTTSGGSVSVSTRAGEGSVLLVVEDTGRGISPDHLPHIFDRFYRVPDAKDQPEKGLGLGLSFVAWIVKAHRGTIDVRSRVGEGTTFTVSLPRRARTERMPRLSLGMPENSYTGERPA